MKTLVKFSLVIGTCMSFSPELLANELLEDGQFDLINRNFYFYRDFRNGAFNPSGANTQLPEEDKEGYRSEWAHGVIAK